MPLFGEIGPLVLDPKMKREVEKSFKEITEDYDYFAAFKSPRLEYHETNQSNEELLVPKEKIFNVMSINEI